MLIQLVIHYKRSDHLTKVLVTTHSGHAAEVVKEMDLSNCAGLVIISGDGLLFEILNGLMTRKDWNTARQIPLGVIPGGSGNGIAAHLGASNPTVASFNIIKGRNCLKYLVTLTT